MADQSKRIIMIAISLMVIAVIIPIAIAQLAGVGDTVVYYPNGTSAGTLTTIADSSIITLLTVLLPIIAIVGVLIYFIPKATKR